MEDLSFGEMLAMQRALWEKNKERWSPLEPQYARDHFLWMIGEIGEALDIVKKCGEDRVMAEPGIRASFTEEMCDVLMYFNDILLRYGIAPRDMARAYRAKHEKNMDRNFAKEQAAFGDRLAKEEGL